MRVFPGVELIASLTTQRHPHKYRRWKKWLAAPNGWVRYMEKYIDTWREGVHDLLMQYAAFFLERPTMDLLRGDALAPPCMNPTVISTSRCAPQGAAAPVRRARSDSSAHMLIPPLF